MLEIRDLAKRYGDVVALAGIDLDVPAGTVTALLGPNGAGKTTLVSIVAGLRAADAGSVRIDAIDALRRRRAARELIGLAPQELAIYPTLTVRENLVFFADLHGVPRRERARRVEEVAGQLDLEPLLGRPARWLSGGEKRRLHTAIALVHRAPLLLLDEPTSGVDVATRRRLLTVVRELAERGAAVCYLTHYLGEVEELEAQIAIVDRGRMLARGTLDELVHDYGDTAVELTLEREPAATTLPAGAALDGRVLRVPTPSPDADLPALLAWAGDAGTPVASVRMLRPSLESVFLRVTGRAARDESEERQRAYAA